MSKKLLIQSYKFPPVHIVGAQRLFRFYHFLAPSFSGINVLTTENQKRFIKDESLLINKAVVEMIPTNDLRTWLLNRGRKGAYLDDKAREKVKNISFSKLYHSFPFVYITGDGGRTYIRKSYKRAAKLIEEEGITHLLSSFRPWADHIVCYRLKKRFPHLIWIADFRDLAIDPIRKDIWWPALQYYFQKRLLKKADIITTVSKGLAKRLAPYAKEILVVRNGLEKLPSGFMTAPLTDKFTITYTGSLYPQLQSAEILFRCLRELINEGYINITHLSLQYAGKDGELWQKWANEYSLTHFSTNFGLLSLVEAKKLQLNTQINLLLSWSAKDYGGIVTAKLADYLYAGRPIVALLNGPADLELTQLVEATGSGHVYPTADPSSPEQLRTFLLDAYRTWQFSGALPWQVNSEKLKPYTWGEQVKKLIEVL